ncbi:MAG: hypothetical protein Kow0070_19860 [Anaerolineales bacterium]
MDKKIAIILILGVLLGAVFGVSFTPVVQNDLLAIVGGALAGVFIGWFIAAALRQR